jgi:hypothetical protein
MSYSLLSFWFFSVFVSISASLFLRATSAAAVAASLRREEKGIRFTPKVLPPAAALRSSNVHDTDRIARSNYKKIPEIGDFTGSFRRLLDDPDILA